MSSGSFTSVDLSQLPAPDVIEVLDHPTMFNQMLSKLRELDPAFDALVPSDPAWKIIEVCTYFRRIDRQHANDRTKAVLLAYAQGATLDHLGAIFGVGRQVLDPGNPGEGIPPTYEGDEDFRRRIQLGPEGYSVAGPEGAYIFHALSADSRVLDASATSPEADDIRAVVLGVLSANGAASELVAAMQAALDAATWPGDVVVSVLSREGTGAASAELLQAVNSKLSSEDVRPMTDHVIVQSAEIVPYEVEADVYTFAGPDSQVVMAESRKRLDRYVEDCHRMGRDVTRSGLFAALHSEGVQRVELIKPAADVVTTREQATHCVAITIRHGGLDE